MWNNYMVISIPRSNGIRFLAVERVEWQAPGGGAVLGTVDVVTNGDVAMVLPAVHGSGSPEWKSVPFRIQNELLKRAKDAMSCVLEKFLEDEDYIGFGDDEEGVGD